MVTRWVAASLLPLVLTISCSKSGDNPSSAAEPPTFLAVDTTYALAIDPGTPNVIYSGRDSGVFKSTDGGANWSPTSLTGVQVTALAIDVLVPTTLFAGTCNNGVFKSTDGGATWIAKGPAGFLPVMSLAIAPRAAPEEPIRLHFSTYWGTVCTSADGGSGWSFSQLPTYGYVYCLAIDPLVPTTVFAGTSPSEYTVDPDGTMWWEFWPGAVFKSMDAGGTWELWGTAASWDSFECVTALAIAPRADAATPVTLYAGASTSAHRSTDGGETWNRVFEGVNSWIQTLAIDPQSPTTVYAGVSVDGVAKSADGGATWGWTGLTNVVVQDLCLDPSDPDILYAGTAVGVYKSSDGGVTWSLTGPADVDQPDTTIASAVDGNGASVGNNGATVSNGITFSFTGTDNVAVSAFEGRLDGAAFGPITSPKNCSGLAIGQHVFEVRAVDPSGNRDSTPATFTWTIDAAPETYITSAVDHQGKLVANGASITSSRIKFAFTGTDNNSVAGFEGSLDGGAFVPRTSPVTFSQVSKGQHTFQVRAYDSNGLRDPTPATFTWTRK